MKLLYGLLLSNFLLVLCSVCGVQDIEENKKAVIIDNGQLTREKRTPFIGKAAIIGGGGAAALGGIALGGAALLGGVALLKTKPLLGAGFVGASLYKAKYYGGGYGGSYGGGYGGGYERGYGGYHGGYYHNRYYGNYGHGGYSYPSVEYWY